MINIAQKADQIADTLRDNGVMSWEMLRDLCDQQTGGDLDYMQLNILTDGVQSRLSKVHFLERIIREAQEGAEA